MRFFRSVSDNLWYISRNLVVKSHWIPTLTNLYSSGFWLNLVSPGPQIKCLFIVYIPSSYYIWHVLLLYLRILDLASIIFGDNIIGDYNDWRELTE